MSHNSLFLSIQPIQRKNLGNMVWYQETLHMISNPKHFQNMPKAHSFLTEIAIFQLEVLANKFLDLKAYRVCHL